VQHAVDETLIGFAAGAAYQQIRNPMARGDHRSGVAPVGLGREKSGARQGRTFEVTHAMSGGPHSCRHGNPMNQPLTRKCSQWVTEKLAQALRRLTR
jgi:hypothetical protein